MVAKGDFAPGNRLRVNRLGELAATAQPASGVSRCRTRTLAIQHEPPMTKIWVWCRTEDRSARVIHYPSGAGVRSRDRMSARTDINRAPARPTALGAMAPANSVDACLRLKPASNG
jgi:hypothetical protein